jgi:predicted enzyme related to lactoylglutathione lyase
VHRSCRIGLKTILDTNVIWEFIMAKFWFDHLHSVVADPEKIADFFVRAFGAEKVSLDDQSDGRVRAELSITGGRMIINTPRSADARCPDSPQERYGAEHFGMKVDDLESALEQSLAAGGELVRGVTEIRPGVKLAFFMAPENVFVELLETR